MINNYAPFTPIPSDPESFLTGIRRADSDFMLRQAQLQGLEGMMTGNDMAKEQLTRYRGETPGALSKSRYEGAMNDARNNTGFIQQMLMGERGASQQQQAAGRMAMGTVDGKIGAENAVSANREVEEMGHFLNMVAASHGPELADNLYQGVLQKMPESKRRALPSRYDPKTWASFRDASIATPSHRRELGKIDQSGAHAMGRQMVGDAADMERERLRQQGANERARLSADTDRAVAGMRGSLQGETPAKAIARLRTILSRNPDNAEDVHEYRMHLEDQWNKRQENDPGIALLRIRALTAEDPAVSQRSQEQYNELRREFFAEKDIYLNAPPAGTARRFPD